MSRELDNDIADFEGEIKAEIFREIFDSMTKNMKINLTQYLRIVLRQEAKTTELQLFLDFHSFKSFKCNSSNNTVRKFQLNKFAQFQSFFQSCKGFLNLKIRQDMIVFTQSSGNRYNRFPVKSQYISQDEQQQLQKIQFLNQYDEQSNYCKVSFTKSKLIQQVIHAGNTMKTDKIYVTYLPNQSKIRFILSKHQNAYIKVKINKQFENKGNIKEVSFPFRKLKLAMGLLQAQKSFTMKLSSRAIIMQFDEHKRKKFKILVCSEIQDEQEF